METIKMKNINIFLALTLGILFLGIASAEVFVDFPIRLSIQETNGDVTLTNHGILGASVEIYSCLNSACTAVNQTPLNINTQTIGSSVRIFFPENLVDSKKYALYFYREGYIGWEQLNVNIYGDGKGEIYTAPTVYLARKRQKSAEIVNFVGTNTSSCININANVVSPITDISQSNIPFNENVSVDITFEVFANNSLVFSQTENRILQYSEVISESYMYCALIENTNYSVLMHTDITDDKIINKIRDTKSFDLIVSDSPICTTNIQFTPWSPWTNQQCVNSTHRQQSRFRIEYDANDCGAFQNVTHWEYRTVEDQSCSVSQDSISITIHSPINGTVYNTTNILLNATSNITANYWIYDLNGDITIVNETSLNLTRVLGNLSQGNHSLLVCGFINNTVADCDTVYFQIILSDGNGENGDGENGKDKKSERCLTCLEPLPEEDTVISLGGKINQTGSTITLDRLESDQDKQGGFRFSLWAWIVVLLLAIAILLVIIYIFKNE